MIPGCSEYAKTTINNHLLYIYRIYEYDDDDEVSICHLIMCMINTTYNTLIGTLNWLSHSQIISQFSRTKDLLYLTLRRDIGIPCIWVSTRGYLTIVAS